MSSVIVGAGSRLGNAIVTRLAFAGHRVIGIDSESPQFGSFIEEMKKVGDVQGMPFQEDENATLSKAASLTKSGINGLVFVPPDNTVKGDIADSTTIQFNTIMAQRLTLPFRIIKAAVPHLRKSSDSSIVIVNSSCAYTPFIDLGLFSAGSTALLSMCKSLAIDASILPIRVNTVVMSTVQHDGSGGLWSDEKENASLRQMMPLGRLGSTADVGNAVEFLLSTKSRYITGESMILNGGMQLRL